jgi:hypothetical protein
MRGLLPHYKTQTAAPNLTIDHAELSTFDTVELSAAPGDAVIFDGFLCHRSQPNMGARARWSIDVRYSGNQAGDFFPLAPRFPVDALSGQSFTYEDYRAAWSSHVPREKIVRRWPLKV